MTITYICFETGSITSATLVGLIEQHDIGFEPERLWTTSFGSSRGVRFTSGSLQRLRDSPADVSAASSLEGEDCIFGVGNRSQLPAQVITWLTARWPSESLIESASTLPGFTAALVGDFDDMMWQSADGIDMYKAHERPWIHLPIVKDDVFDRDKIDVSQNPGRKVGAPGMWLWPAAKMWFGPGSFRVIDSERLLAAPVGDVSVRPDGCVVVELFSLGDDMDTIRDAQQQFRDWLDFDAIAARDYQRPEIQADPHLEIETGDFEHGGVRRVTLWFNADGGSSRSAATEKHSVELDDSGSVVWEEVVVL
jgi:hypothetical protein